MMPPKPPQNTPSARPPGHAKRKRAAASGLARAWQGAGPLALALVLAWPATPAAAAPTAAAAAGAAQVAWIPAAGDADIERAFAQGKAEGKPVLVYWGAQWCPPCNQL